MEQTRKESFIEAGINTVIAYVVSVSAQLIIFPMFDIILPLETNMLIVGIFTMISFVRVYLLRRFFNSLLKRAAITISEEI